MRTITTVMAGAALLTAGMLCATTANAAPTNPRSADDLVMQLESQGNTVIVNRTGTQPLSQCTVTAVRPGQTYTRYDSGYPGAQQDPMTQVTSMTIYVEASC